MKKNYGLCLMFLTISSQLFAGQKGESRDKIKAEPIKELKAIEESTEKQCQATCKKHNLQFCDSFYCYSADKCTCHCAADCSIEHF